MTKDKLERIAEEAVGKKLTLRQEEFCQLFVSEDFYGNGTQTYLEVYDIDHSKPNWYKTAQVCASQLLSNPMVCARINELLEEGGLNDNHVDKQLLFLITQNADYTNKTAAIREYNKLKQRITDKVDVTSKGKRMVSGFNYIIPTPDGDNNANTKTDK